MKKLVKKQKVQNKKIRLYDGEGCVVVKVNNCK